MDEFHRHYFKRHLEDLLEELLRQAGEAMQGLLELEGSASDPLDRATLDAEHNFWMRIRGRERTLINKIRQRLDDIAYDEYGVCEDCGKGIAIARLKARPVASRCIGCKTRQEERERLISA